jgi:predicted alpha/beta hydrolase family esterase
MGDDSLARWQEAVAVLKRLKAEGRLPPAHADWIARMEGEVAKVSKKR